MRSLLVLSFLGSFCISAHGQFSTDWLGEWKGELQIYNEKGLQQKVTMGLIILAESDSSWKWQIIYGEGEEAQLRDYRLKKNPIDPSQFILDEQNSIQLFLSKIHNGFYSWFGVMDNELMVSYKLIEGKIHFKTISSVNKDFMMTGNEEGNPQVTAQKVKTIQEAILTKRL